MKFIKSLPLLVLLTSPLLSDFIRVEGGAGIWSATASGDASYGTTNNYNLGDDFDLENKENANYIWAYVKHPLPILPNVRVEMTKFETTGTSETSIEFGGQTYSATADTLLNLDQTDAILYYNILDNTFWMTVDLGLDLKTFAGSMKVGNEEADISATIPLFYGRARVSVPATELSFEATTKVISYDGSSLSDTTAKVDYNFFTSPAIDLAIEAGYKLQNLTLDSDDIDVKADISVSGMFAGINAKF